MGASGAHELAVDRINTHSVLVDIYHRGDITLSVYNYGLVEGSGLASDAPHDRLFTASGCTDTFIHGELVLPARLFDVSQPFTGSVSVDFSWSEYCVSSAPSSHSILESHGEQTNEGIQYIPYLHIFQRNYSVPSHKVGGLSLQMYLPAWNYEVVHESNSILANFIKNGITYGFDIVDSDHQIQEYDCANYSSVLNGDSHAYVNKLILQEIGLGKLLIVSEKPICIHSLGAVGKTDGSF